MRLDFTALTLSLRELGPDEARRFAVALHQHGTDLTTSGDDNGRGAVYVALSHLMAASAHHQATQLAALDRQLHTVEERP